MAPAGGSGPDLEVAAHAVLRVAAWPVEAASGFGSADLASAVRAVQTATSERVAAGADLADRAFAVVPDVAAPDLRRWLIKVRRVLHAGADPFVAPPPIGADEVPAVAALVASIDEERARRDQVAADVRELVALVDAQLVDELVALRREAGSPAFRIALGLANDAVAEKWARLLDRDEPPVVAPKARVRRLEGTVLHYFLRACGRPTPHGTFAGIVPVVPASPSSATGSSNTGAPVVPAGAATVDRTNVEPSDGSAITPPETSPVGGGRSVRAGDAAATDRSASADEPATGTAAGGSDGTASLIVEPAEGAVRVEPDLGPFVETLATWRAALANTPDHPLRRNPTLHQGADGCHVWHPLGGSEWLGGTVPPELLAVVDRWPGGLRATRTEVARDLPGAHVDAAIASGLLESTVVLDPDAVDVWTALRDVAPALPSPERERWLAAVDGAQACCAELAGAISRDDEAGVRSGTAALAEAVGRLGASAPAMPRVDRRLPLLATWDDAARAGAASAIRRVLWLHHHDGAAEAYRRARLTLLLGQADPVPAGGARASDRPADRGGVSAGAAPGVVVASGDAYEVDPSGVAAGAPDGDGVTAAPPAERRSLLDLAASNAAAAAPTVPGVTRADALAKVGVVGDGEAGWAALLAGRPAADPILLDVRTGPGVPPGAGVVGTAVLTAACGTWWYRWGRPQPGMLQTRFVSLLPAGGAEELHGIERAVGAASVVGADHPNPTVAVHARAAGRTIGRVGAAADALDGDVATVSVAGPARGLLGGPLGPPAGTTGTAGTAGSRPVYDSVAAIATSDPLGRYLGALSMAQGWELLVYGSPPIARDELVGAGVARVVLGDTEPVSAAAIGIVVGAGGEGTVVSPRRWTIGLDDLALLRSHAGAEQYLAWRAIADRFALDDLVLVRWSPIPGSAEYLFPTTSPLAVRSLLDHLGEGEGPLVATELPGPVDGWPVRSPAGHHLSELAVTWWRGAPHAAGSSGRP